MRKSAFYETIKNYVKTTTLHGFKYLCSTYYIDRIIWLVWCGASACCAGVLCAVLWARFLEVPALLTLSQNINNDEVMEDKIPAIIVCPTTENLVDKFMEKFSAENPRISAILARLLTGKFIRKDRLRLLDDFLVDRNLSLADIMLNNEMNCIQHTKRCRYQEAIVACKDLFQPELTTYGACCVINPIKLKNLSEHFEARKHTTPMLDLVLQFTQGSRIHGCEMITMYDSEEDNGSDLLSPATLYMAYQKFIVISKNPATDNLMESNCERRKGYSRTLCMRKCAEMFCGCRDPLSPEGDDVTVVLPICPVTRLDCVRATENNRSCACLPPCKRFSTSLVLDSSDLNIQYTRDPFLYITSPNVSCTESGGAKRGSMKNLGLNVTSSIVVKLRVNLAHSRTFLPIPTDTWVTLLSSLGGVFNMFLGVGLFSALEFLFLILVKLPAALKKSPEMDPVAKYDLSVQRQFHFRHNEVLPYRDRQKHQHFTGNEPHKQNRIARY